MKMLFITGLHFRLPDEFNGSLSDALRLLADHYDNIRNKPSTEHTYINPAADGSSYQEVSAKMFDTFLDVVKIGKKMVGLVKICDFNLNSRSN